MSIVEVERDSATSIIAGASVPTVTGFCGAEVVVVDSLVFSANAF